MGRLAAASLTLLLSFALAAEVRAEPDHACLDCHGIKDSGVPLVSGEIFSRSVHGGLGCSGCHSDKDGYPHAKRSAAVSCAGCHDAAAKAVRASDHGRHLVKFESKSGAGLCLSCHSSPHDLRRVKDAHASVSRGHILETCNQCHQKRDFKAEFGVEPMSSYADTVHGKAFLGKKNLRAAVCTDCHGSHDLDYAKNSSSKAYRFNIPKTCGRCHPGPAAAYARSIHGAKAASGVKDSPVCTDCHGEHTIKAQREPGSSVFTGSIVKTCSNCHGSEKLIAKFGMPLDPTKAYSDSYHGVAFRAGNLSSANCSSCHGHHDILPSSDTASSVHPGNLQKTCGACHARAGELVSMGKVHRANSTPAPDFQEKVLRLVKWSYVLLIALTIGGMLGHNMLDHKRKMLLGPAHGHAAGERLSLNERLQHLALMATFIGLAYTGFCHTYPEAVWSKVVFHGAGGAAARSFLHRALAAAFMGLSVYHILWLGAAKEGRSELLAMLPRRRDVVDAFQLQLYNLLHRGTPPKFDRFNYMEKAEYWALIWGSFVMVATGCVAWFRDLSLRFIPKWCIDLALLIHFMEAILACLAILVWHSYWTVFDVDVYPMNWAWITGKIRRGPDHQDAE
ncbi:MAG: cytochrome b/b6 domain-containing protein [Elusimicrobia bacterium]|nr:cytochrome b/b6 domain-containing protein [Elusimicrobiota bacterium]